MGAAGTTCFIFSLARTSFTWLPLFPTSAGEGSAFFSKTTTLFSLLHFVFYFCWFIPVSLTHFFPPLLPIFSRNGGADAAGLAPQCHRWVSAVSFSFLHPPTSPPTSSGLLSPLHYLRSWCVWEALFHVLTIKHRFVTKTVAEVSAMDLPPTSQLSFYQSILYRWFLSPYSYPVFPLFPPLRNYRFSCSVPFLESVLTHIWPHLVSDSQIPFVFRYLLRT